MKYDYLIVGSGLYGATFAYLAKQKGKNILAGYDHIYIKLDIAFICIT